MDRTRRGADCRDLSARYAPHSAGGGTTNPIRFQSTTTPRLTPQLRALPSSPATRPLQRVARLAETLLDKRGGYLSNDIFPPGVWLDNVPSWEFGVLVQIRDMSREMRLDFSRSQSQSAEDPDLSEAEGKFYLGQRELGIPGHRRRIPQRHSVSRTLHAPPRRPEPAQCGVLSARGQSAQLAHGGFDAPRQLVAAPQQCCWKAPAEYRPRRRQSTYRQPAPGETEVKTPWLEIDDVFYEARGHTWALLHLLHAIDHDFKDVLEKKNARVSLQQIIRELEPTQAPIWSPMVLNGDGLRARCESLAGDGVVHLAGERGDHRSEESARAGVSPSESKCRASMSRFLL